MKIRKTGTGIKGLYLKHGCYVYQAAQVDGVRPKRIALQTSNLIEALKKIETIKRDGFIKQQTDPLSELCERYMKAKRASAQHKGEQTTLSAKYALQRLQNYTKAKVDRIDGKMIEAWRDSMLAETKEDGTAVLSRASIGGYMRYAQSFFSWCVDEGILIQSPFARLKRAFPKSIPTRRERACDKALRDRLIAECTHPVLQTVLFIGFHAGLRRDEILNLRPHWIMRDEEGRPTHIHIQNEDGKDGTTPFTVKDNESKIVPLNEPLAAHLSNAVIDESQPYIIAPEKNGGRNRYRWDWRKPWQKYMKDQQAEWVTPHVMRHTFISLLLSAPGAPSLLHLERWTGTSVEVLKKSYAHLFEDRDLINVAN